MEIIGVLERLHRDGHTIVLITHELNVASYAHRVIHLRDGTVEKEERNEPVMIAVESSSETRR